MILKIDFDEKNVIYKGNGRILLKVKYFAKFANACHLATVEANTKEEFDDQKIPYKASKTLNVGQRGGLSLF